MLFNLAYNMLCFVAIKLTLRQSRLVVVDTTFLVQGFPKVELENRNHPQTHDDSTRLEVTSISTRTLTGEKRFFKVSVNLSF